MLRVDSASDLYSAEPSLPNELRYLPSRVKREIRATVSGVAFALWALVVRRPAVAALALAVAPTWSMYVFWFPFFIAWIIKALLARYDELAPKMARHGITLRRDVREQSRKLWDGVALPVAGVATVELREDRSKNVGT